MVKVNITKDIEQAFLELVYSIFKDGKIEKKEKGKIVCHTSIKGLDHLLKKKLKNFDSDITFEKLILADFNYLKKLVNFLDKNQKRTELTKKEKKCFFTIYERLKRDQLVKKLNITTCLYCNRNYIFNFKKGNEENTTAEIDHFFNKSTYPYLAVCLYNLIPCCPTCNKRKSNKQEPILHPYVESFDQNAKFHLEIKKASFYHSVDGFEIDIKVKNEALEEQVKHSIDMFNLERLYQNHKDIVLELIQKSVVYNESYLDELLKEYEGTLFKNREDLQRLISGGYISDEEIGKRPLSKLIKDISEELELI